MSPYAVRSKWTGSAALRRAPICASILALITLTFSCGTLERSNTTPYFAEAVPPARQEFRWSNGRLPRSFDPASAIAPPETDVARAIFEGLTILDPAAFQALPGVAEKWSSTEDNKQWKFHLRRNAKWTNGKPVTAHDFVRAWNRLNAPGASANSALLINIARRVHPKVVDSRNQELTAPSPEQPTLQPQSIAPVRPSPMNNGAPAQSPQETPDDTVDNAMAGAERGSESTLAVAADGDHILNVSLVNGDPDFPKLVSNTAFYPIHGDGSEFDPPSNPASIVTNGPFRIVNAGSNGVVLERAATYWNRDDISLDSVKFVPADTVDEALEAYRAGTVDAVTNAEYEPLVLKLLAPYEDFRRATHGTLNLYEINISKQPYSDRRVREALAIAIERERLTEGELEGATRPASRFLPFGGDASVGLIQDVEKAKRLLAAAGFPAGEGFPVIRLVVNRNDTQLRVARAVARMWKQNLGLTTELIVKEQNEIFAIRQRGDFDVIRRGVVFSTSDRISNLAAIFHPNSNEPLALEDLISPSSSPSPLPTDSGSAQDPAVPDEAAEPAGYYVPVDLVRTEVQAIYHLPAIPLYFPTSYSLVKPYVQGFEPNALDIYSLRNVVINNGWQPKRPGTESY